jgi:polyisoprenoid-binding protein YceI
MGNWQLDPYHTQVEFSAKHLAMMTVRGYFDELSATADIDPEHPETASVEVTISTASIRTNNGRSIRRSSSRAPAWSRPEATTTN